MRILALAAALTALSALATGGQGPAPAAAAAACVKPTALRFERRLGATVGVLRWRPPRSLPATAAGYRVYRDRAVVGQTRGRAIRARITPGKKVTFSVRVALRSGATLSCRSTLVQRLNWRLPTAPHDVTVREQEDGLLVAWSPSKRGEGRIVGYRIFRDGAPVGQVKSRSVLVPLPPLRTAKLQIRAVDNRGKTGPASAPIQVVRGHRAPTVPAGVTGSAVSDREIDLAWSSSTGSGGARVSYQVRRDGRVLTQTAATGVRAGNLFPATRYSFTVTAVDSLGYRSEESAPVEVTTRPPAQSSGDTFAFLLASTDRSFQALQEHYTKIGTVIPTYFDCRPDGVFEGRDDPLVTVWAKLRGIRVHARWNCQRTATLSRILRDPGVRETTIAGIVATVVGTGYDGVNLDFEAGAAADRDVFSSFVRDLAGRLHEAGKALSVDVSAKFADVRNHPRSTFYDYDALAESADDVIVMAWGIHWTTSAPGAIDELSWVTRVADYVAARPRRDRFVLGFGLYGIDWPAGGGSAHPGTALEYEDVMALAGRFGATPSFDPVAQAPTFRYTTDGVQHDVWYVDADSLARRLDLARARGLRIGLWRLGREDPGIWRLPQLQP
jgi:spore germination protein YaaH